MRISRPDVVSVFVRVCWQSRKSFPAFTIIRFGSLKGSTSSSRVQIQPGDALDGEIPVSDAADLLLQALTRTEAINATLSAGLVGASASDAVSDASTG